MRTWGSNRNLEDSKVEDCDQKIEQDKDSDEDIYASLSAMPTPKNVDKYFLYNIFIWCASCMFLCCRLPIVGAQV